MGERDAWLLEDRFHATMVAAVGCKTVSLVCCIGSALGFAKWGVCDRDEDKRRGGEM